MTGLCTLVKDTFIYDPQDAFEGAYYTVSAMLSC